MAPPNDVSLGRIPIVGVSPSLEEGRWPAKAVVGEAVPITATVFREGHDAEGANVLVTSPDGTVTNLPMSVANWGLSIYRAYFTPLHEGHFTFQVEAWSDPVGTWQHAADVKIHAGVDVQLMLEEGVIVLNRALTSVDRPATQQRVIQEAIDALKDTFRTPQERIAVALSHDLKAVLRSAPLRDGVSRSRVYPLRVERERAMFSAWYEFFPRSEGAKFNTKTGTWTSGTFLTASKRLPKIAEMGFDVVYLTPIHPIGLTHRKGRNNSLKAEPGDPGSPYAIGAAEGGHDAVHPELGSMRQFRNFVTRAHEEGLEVALDIALQCSPDHPWVKEHPEWFTMRADGSIAYAENPPKKYQDIYPLNFDNDPEGIYQAIRDMLYVWIEAGVTLFRVDNPHTKSVDFWERILAEVASTNPEVIFLAEAFTRPAMMHTLAKIGYHQSYTYFTWRQTAKEMGAYLEEVHGDGSFYMRPNFWPTTHDILTPDMQRGGAPIFKVRAVLAATGSPSYGIYTGYELVENVPRPGAEEQIDNEKYEFKARDWSNGDRYGIETLFTQLNAARHAHPSLQRLRGLTVHWTSNDQLICYSKHLSAEESPTGKPDTVIVLASFDPYHKQTGFISLDLEALDMADDETFEVVDALTGEVFHWGKNFYVEFDPAGTMTHVASVSY